jgi:hypothetical protein
MSDREQLTAALEPLRAMLRADGYELQAAREADGALKLDVLATPEACAECLAPAGVIASVARSCLRDAGFAQDVELTVAVPAASGGAHGAQLAG